MRLSSDRGPRSHPQTGWIRQCELASIHRSVCQAFRSDLRATHSVPVPTARCRRCSLRRPILLRFSCGHATAATPVSWSRMYSSAIARRASCSATNGSSSSTCPRKHSNRHVRTGLPIRREFSLAPGRYFATILLRDRANGMVGSVRHEFDVPWPDGLRITTPVVTDTLQSAAPGQAGRPVPIARRTFRAGARLFCAFDVIGAGIDSAAGGPRVTLAYSLRRVADGAEVLAGPPGQLRPGTVTIAIDRACRRGWAPTNCAWSCATKWRSAPWRMLRLLTIDTPVAPPGGREVTMTVAAVGRGVRDR